MAGQTDGQTATWFPPRVGSREHRALGWLAKIEPPGGVVLPPSLWAPAARAGGLSVWQVKRLARRAADAGDPRLTWYAEHRERLRRRTRRGPTAMPRARQANWLRQRGLSWPQVARACGYADGATARKMAGRYQERLANGGSLPRARLAYKRRERGERWPLIARRLGYANDRTARGMARRFAERAGLPWPVPILEAERGRTQPGVALAAFRCCPPSAFDSSASKRTNALLC